MQLLQIFVPYVIKLYKAFNNLEQEEVFEFAYTTVFQVVILIPPLTKKTKPETKQDSAQQLKKQLLLRALSITARIWENKVFSYCPSYSGRRYQYLFSPANISWVALKHSRTLCLLVDHQTKLLYSRTWKGFQNSHFVCHHSQRCHSFHLGSARTHSHEIAEMVYIKRLLTRAWGRKTGTEVLNMKESACSD